jgi:hypothetical protein
METNLNLSNYTENYNFQLIDLSFQYFDSNQEKEKYEEVVDLFIQEFSNYRPAETKLNLKLLVEFIERLSNAEESYLEENLRCFSKFLNIFIFIFETK